MNTATLEPATLATQLDIDGLLPPRPSADLSDPDERRRAEKALQTLERAAGRQRITLIPLADDLSEQPHADAPTFAAAFMLDPVSKTKTILYNARAPLARRLWAIAHELGHATLGHRYKALAKGEADREADTIADLLCQHFQLPTVQTVASWHGATIIRRPARPLSDAVARLVRSGAA